MKQEMIKMVEELFDTAENLTEKNFAKVVELADNLKMPVIFVKYGYYYGSDILWDAGVVISPSHKFSHIYGSIKPTSNPEELDRILEFAINVAHNDEFAKMYGAPVYECLPDNCELVETPSGVKRYAVKDIDSMELLVLNEFPDYLETINNTREIGDN